MRGISEESLRHVMKMHDMNDSKTSLIFSHLFNECKELNAWQPIETAPKDRRVNLYWENYGWFTGQWRLGQFFCDANLMVPCNIYPTHWQELPEDPK